MTMSMENLEEKTAAPPSPAANGTTQTHIAGPARPTTPAHIIADDQEAIQVAHRLAERFAQEASVRDREQRLPLPELDDFSQSGLWGMMIPQAYGGAEVSYSTVSEMITIISAADPSLGQLPQNHIAVLDMIRLCANEE